MPTPFALNIVFEPTTENMVAVLYTTDVVGSSMTIISKVVSLLNIYVILLTDAMITCVTARSLQNWKFNSVYSGTVYSQSHLELTNVLWEITGSRNTY
jgi:hypothetical protein